MYFLRRWYLRYMSLNVVDLMVFFFGLLWVNGLRSVPDEIEQPYDKRMPSEEGDSGIEAMSTPESRESSPKNSEIKSQPIVEIPAVTGIDSDDEEPEETLSERLIGLTEMFPESLRNGVCGLVSSSKSGMGSLYAFSRAALWIFFSSSAILVAPVIFEMERLQMDEMQKQQQRQILLGPSAAVSGGMGTPPGLGVPQPPRS